MIINPREREDSSLLHPINAQPVHNFKITKSGKKSRNHSLTLHAFLTDIVEFGHSVNTLGPKLVAAASLHDLSLRLSRSFKLGRGLLTNLPSRTWVVVPASALMSAQVALLNDFIIDS
jgi:hypothetical protein